MRADIYDVVLTNDVLKQAKKLPSYLVLKLQAWVDAVGRDGLHEVRKISGYHDEPLKGKRTGQRSIRLNRAYRAFYEIRED